MKSRNSQRLTIVVSLFLEPGREAEFERFESAVTAIMRRYGGELERRIACTPQGGDNPPHEVHIVTFPDEESFARYRNDADFRPMAEPRARAIRETKVWRGVELGAVARGAV